MEILVEPPLDYTRVRTPEDLQRWAIDAFHLRDAEVFAQRSIASALFDLLNVQDQRMIVREVNASQMSEQMRLLMTDPANGLYSVLGFHLHREGKNASVFFSRQDER
jgi:hypothetical protein